LPLKVYNTLTRKKEEFVPFKEKEVKIYVCGVTLYNEQHLGHARHAVVFDVIRRYLEYKGYGVSYVTNFTDVDDKMIARAQFMGISIFDLAERFKKEYFEQMQELDVKKASFYPCATEHIKEIIDLIRQLEKSGLAYCVEGDVFFRVKRFPPYGKLSHQSLEDILAGARLEVDEKKENPLDFALWKKAKKDEPSWDSPWGKGRPGWHIECSAMAMKHLGNDLDIHGGGKDLIFPHHENEIAQSEGATGKRFVKYWLHNGLVTMKDAKMAKSTGNVLALSHALCNYGRKTTRYFLLSAHYRSPLDYNENSFQEASASLERIHNTLRRIGELKEEQKNNLSEPTAQTRARAKELYDYLKRMEDSFTEAMDDDFNVPTALSIIFESVKKANLLLREEKRLDSFSLQVLLETQQKIKTLGGILGLFQKEEKKKAEGKEKELIEILICTRDKLRKKKDWKLADEIRKNLDELGIELEDHRHRLA